MKNITQALKVVTLALTLSFGISYVYAWTAPTVTPPGGNVSAPINTSATAQYKDGSLGVGGLLKGYGNIQAVTKVEAPQYCIGASCITSWPTGGVTPPAGSEFLNTSATAQTKAGDLKVSGSIGIGLGASSPAQKLDVAGSAQITGTIFGGGAQTTYGATTVRGAKNGWSGINFAASSGANNGTLMMHPSYSGFYNAADNNWRMYVTDAGNVYATDVCTTTGKCLSAVAAGATGATGPQGPAGATGATGATGPQGPAGIVTGGGVKQLWKAVAGQTIGCAFSNWRVDATVDTSGNYYVRVRDTGWGGDSGWVAGPTVLKEPDGSSFSMRTLGTVTLAGVTLEVWASLPQIGIRCNASWS